MLSQPVADRLAGARRVLLAGCGGHDVPLAARGAEVHRKTLRVQPREGIPL